MEEQTTVNQNETETATTPNEILIPVKFNKQQRNLNLEEAITLSQKGLKYESLEGDLGRLKDIAISEKLSVSAFLDRLEQERTQKRKDELMTLCGQNEQLADHVIELEKANKIGLTGQSEFSEFFPDIKPDDLPDEVKENALSSGRSILDEYLRYSLKKQREAEQNGIQAEQNKNSAVGSLKTADQNNNPERAEFINAVWN